MRRRWVPAVAVIALVLVCTFTAALVWPPTYRSTGTILIEQQEVPSDLVRSMVSSYADQRIQMISQRVMTTENLIRIIDRYNLYPDDRRNVPREQLLARMRDDIRFSMISADVVDPRSGRPTKASIAFSIGYDSRSAALAAKVANELSSLYLNENLESRKQLADDTAGFLDSEASRLAKHIAELEAKLAAFKERNVNNLPELTALNIQLMSRTEEEMRETDTRIRSLDQQIVYLDAQLAQLQPASSIYTSTGERVMSPSDRLKVLRSELARASGIYAPTHPDISRMKREIAGLEKEVGKVDVGNDLARQLEEAQAQLAQARERYAEDHPDVAQLERLVSAMEQQMRESPVTAEAVREDPDNPAYIQVSAQREASIAERTSLQRKRDALDARIADLERRLERAPEVEREYSVLARELDNARLKYSELRQKQMEATLSKNLEVERKGERFTLIEPPLAPEEPVSPNRPAILALGFILSIGAAIALVAAMEMLDTSVRGKRELELLVQVPPLAVLPWIETPMERDARARMRRYSFAGAAMSVFVIVALLHFLYRPLDVLWAVALRRLVG